jgi:hypothetical protein
MSMFKSETVWTGNTFGIKDQIKSLGGKWDGNRKAWVVPALPMSRRSEAGLLANKAGVDIRVA